MEALRKTYTTTNRGAPTVRRFREGSGLCLIRKKDLPARLGRRVCEALNTWCVQRCWNSQLGKRIWRNVIEYEGDLVLGSPVNHAVLSLVVYLVRLSDF